MDVYGYDDKNVVLILENLIWLKKYCVLENFKIKYSINYINKE